MRNWILRDLCHDNLIEAIERNIIEHHVFFASRHPSMEVITREDFILVDTKIPSCFFNYVYTVRCSSDYIEKRIKATIEYFKLKNTPFSWMVGPTTSLELFKPALESLGLEKQEESHCMVIALHELKKRLKYIKGFDVQQALTKSTITDVGRVYATLRKEQEMILDYFGKISTLSFRGSDPIRLFVGYLHEKPAIVGELYLGAGIAGLRCSVAHSFKSQEKELMLDLTMKMLFQAKEEGYHFAMIKTFKESCHYFNALGFQKYCEFIRFQ
jgi:hypothetical protein